LYIHPKSLTDDEPCPRNIETVHKAINGSDDKGVGKEAKLDYSIPSDSSGLPNSGYSIVEKLNSIITHFQHHNSLKPFKVKQGEWVLPIPDIF
jgi:hypothetical protein